MSELADLERCTLLRTKRMYYDVYDDGTGTAGTGENANYWCSKTLTVIGPDDGFVGREECVRGRGCFKGIDD